MRGSISSWICSLPYYKKDVDLSGVSRAALLKIVGGVAGGKTRAKTVSHISLSGARLMASSRSGTADLMLKSSESTTEWEITEEGSTIIRRRKQTCRWEGLQSQDKVQHEILKTYLR
jgi:hypothetical protein